MKITELLQSLDDVIQSINKEYLAVTHVGPNYPNADGSYVKSPGLSVSLIRNGKKVPTSDGMQYIGLSCLGGNNWTDESIRNTVKKYYNISDDIEVRYMN